MAPSRRSTASRASTATITDDSSVAWPFGPRENYDYQGRGPGQSNRPARLVIAIDFGTTYSAVSYVSLAEGEDPAHVGPDRIRSIENFPGDRASELRDRMRVEVPTEVIYPKNRNFRTKEKWGMNAGETNETDGSENDGDHEMEELPHDEEMEQEGDMDADDDGGNDYFNDEDRVNTNQFQWGYEVHRAWRYPNTHFDRANQALARFKLLLDASETTEAVRNQLAPTLDSLQTRNIIRRPLVVIADYLTCLLRHTRSELRKEGFSHDHPVELVMCVPAIWSQKACRDMQTAMAIAMQQANFQGVDIQNNSIENLFIVAEPEAAAAHVLATDRTIRPNDTFMLLDAGGGTVDANTYRVSQTTPLSLTNEVVAPGGGLFGSSYLNEAFRAHLLERLAGQTYLEHENITIAGIVEVLVAQDFETDIKRNFDIYDSNKSSKKFWVNSIQRNPQKGFDNGCIYVTFKAIKDMFEGCLQGIEGIMRDQIEKASYKDVQIDKVILIGGFAASQSLRQHLRRCLASLSQTSGKHIELVVPENQVTAVASGAVLRALVKDQGPERISRSSYGILRTEPFGQYIEHELANAKATRDKLDGHDYLMNTIDWVLKRGIPVLPVWECEPIICSHTFHYSPSAKLVCREVLYVSDTAIDSHYHRKYRHNKGAEKAGEIVADFTFLREQGLIHPVEPLKCPKTGRPIRRRHYKVEYKMIIKVIDRDLRCYAIYNDEVVKECRINIASAFRPGVK